MRFEGTLKSWNDERGFGFIEPARGGEPVFVRIKAFTVRQGRPQVGQRVVFEVEVNAQGRKRAKNVEFPRPARMRTRRDGSAAWGTATLFAVPVFLMLCLVVGIAWRIPGWMVGAYAAASVVSFVVYAMDKSAAIAGRWRVSERTLLALGLVGGWPGAIVAQQVLRHKSIKGSFRSAFWVSVLANVVAFVVFSAPPVRAALGY
jgi:uncharacterized membrane protein YsdA (DUF1294 family)/cold shock CspA family protein